jgi:hypothetical protein
MDNPQRAQLVELVRSARKTVQDVWGHLVAMDPEDTRAISEASQAYQSLLKLDRALISRPVEERPGEEVCAFCNGLTENHY